MPRSRWWRRVLSRISQRAWSVPPNRSIRARPSVNSISFAKYVGQTLCKRRPRDDDIAPGLLSLGFAVCHHVRDEAHHTDPVRLSAGLQFADQLDRVYGVKIEIDNDHGRTTLRTGDCGLAV